MVKKLNPPPPKPPVKQIGFNKTIILRTDDRSLSDEDIEKLEQKYSDKFGCKVVVLEPGIKIESI